MNSTVMPAALQTSSEASAIFVEPTYFGGRTHIGNDFREILIWWQLVAIAIFSWFYVLIFLYSSNSQWQFLPFSKPEFARITLRQKIVWHRLFPFAIWWVISVIAIFAPFLLLTGIQYLLVGLGGDSIPVFYIIAYPSSFIGANVLLARSLAK